MSYFSRLDGRLRSTGGIENRLASSGLWSAGFSSRADAPWCLIIKRLVSGPHIRHIRPPSSSGVRIEPTDVVDAELTCLLVASRTMRVARLSCPALVSERPPVHRVCPFGSVASLDVGCDARPPMALNPDSYQLQRLGWGEMWPKVHCR